MSNQATYNKEQVNDAIIDNAAASGELSLVPAVAGCFIRVIEYGFLIAGAANLTFQTYDGSEYDAICGVLPFNATTTAGWERPFNPFGYFQTAVGEALTLNIDAAVQVGGSLLYQYVNTGTP